MRLDRISSDAEFSWKTQLRRIDTVLPHIIQLFNFVFLENYVAIEVYFSRGLAKGCRGGIRSREFLGFLYT